MPETLIPSTDEDLIKFAKNIGNRILDNPGSADMSAAEADEFSNLVAAFIAAKSNTDQKKIELKSAAAAKRAAYKDLVRAIRNATRAVKANREITDEMLEAFGLPIPDRTRTRNAPPDSTPFVVRIENANFLHNLHFRDSENFSRRPAHTIGCEIWMAFGNFNEPPAAEEFRFVKLATRSPARVEFELANVGKQAYYRLRWVNRRGEPGGWSDTFQNTVTS